MHGRAAHVIIFIDTNDGRIWNIRKNDRVPGRMFLGQHGIEKAQNKTQDKNRSFTDTFDGTSFFHSAKIGLAIQESKFSHDDGILKILSNSESKGGMLLVAILNDCDQVIFHS